MKNKMKNTLLKKTYIWAVFPLRGPASAFVGCWGLRGLLWISCTSKKNTLKKKLTYGPNDARRVVWALFPLRGLPFPSSSALVGCCGPSWAFMAVVHAKEGVWWVWCSRLSCTVHSHRHGGYARVGLLTRVCTGWGYCQAYPHPYPLVPVPVTLGVWPDPCLSLVMQGNNLLIGTLSRLDSTALRSKLEINMSAYLAEKIARLRPTDKERITNITIFEDWLSEISLLNDEIT